MVQTGHIPGRLPGPPGSDSPIPSLPTETAACHLSTDTFSQEHGFKTRVGVRIWVVNAQIGLGMAPQSLLGLRWKKMELKQGRESRAVPPPPLDREQEVVGSLNKWAPLKLLDVPQITANNGPDLGQQHARSSLRHQN